MMIQTTVTPNRRDTTQRYCALRLLFFIPAVLLALALTGCATGKSASASFASVDIKGRTFAEIKQTTIMVFQQDGYRNVVATDRADIQFEREGTRGEQIARAGFIGSHYGETVISRVRVQILDLVDGSHRLQCRAYMVRTTGDKFFDEETPLTNMRGGPYQNLLDKVAKQLK